MRQALGLLRDSQRSPGNARAEPRRHRFARDGEVAVTVLNSSGPDTGSALSPRSRLIAVEEALTAEREAHGRTRRQLTDALATIQALETKHAHAELARAEAIGAERTAREQVEAELQQLRAQVPVAAEQDVTEPAAEAPPLKQRRKVGRPAGVSARAERRNPEPRAVETDPEPVKWWLPSYRNKKRRG
ncbi:MAG TPA: hypothetical protein VHS58_07350 [Acetobacteraceae bacterium]|jgi:hypothetical protein|nr:hypothetical protein [Acetobacteraceae bacterium]